MMRKIHQLCCLFATCLAMTGCAAQNYDFKSTGRERTRIEHMVDELDRHTVDNSTDEDELYAIKIVPLVHSELHVFSEVEEDDNPAKYIEVEIESCLPLFGFFNGKFTQYDESQRLIDQHVIESNLWGAFRNETELIATTSGDRERTRHTVLWLFSWWGDERWSEHEQSTSRVEVKEMESSLPSHVQYSSD